MIEREILSLLYQNDKRQQVKKEKVEKLTTGAKHKSLKHLLPSIPHKKSTYFSYQIFLIIEPPSCYPERREIYQLMQQALNMQKEMNYFENNQTM